MANFIFTSCGSICPRMTDEMKRVAKAFNNDDEVAILSYSVTPWIDTPEKLKAYKQKKDLGFTKDSTEFLHTEHFILVDKTKRIRGIYNGTL